MNSYVARSAGESASHPIERASTGMPSIIFGSKKGLLLLGRGSVAQN
jgi:hypothetical protein